jgi:L-alanine-DL-glutamate epimerase-like enolase superfamily enzyme
MKIRDIRFEILTGETRLAFPIFEERLIRPLDVYPEQRALGPSSGGRYRSLGDDRWEITSVFLYVETDEDLTGLMGPITSSEAEIIGTQLRALVIGEDPLASERVWDKAYRHLIHGRKGPSMMALSALDCALWDIRGKTWNLPVHRLLGGPVRTTFPAYASMLGFPIDPETAARLSRDYVEQGYRALKWFVRDGPMDGEAGVRRIEQLMRSIREAVGEDVDIMIDAWNSWDARYAVRVAKRLEPHRPRWLEEVVKPDDIPGYARVRAASPVPIAGGEHEYTRWGARDYLLAGAVDVYQPDTLWAGGITEMTKICAMASAFDVPVIPHGHSVPVNAHITACQSPPQAPLIEYLIQWNEVHQLFFKNPVRPVNGLITVSDLPGLGLEIDEDKVRERRPLKV